MLLTGTKTFKEAPDYFSSTSRRDAALTVLARRADSSGFVQFTLYNFPVSCNLIPGARDHLNPQVCTFSSGRPCWHGELPPLCRCVSRRFHCRTILDNSRLLCSQSARLEWSEAADEELPTNKQAKNLRIHFTPLSKVLHLHLHPASALSLAVSVSKIKS